MTLHSALEWVIPTGVARVTRAAFLNGNVYKMMRDRLEELFTDSDRRTQFRADYCSHFSSGQLALITVMQFVEQLTDRQAAEAVRSRRDWQYALELKPTYSKFDASELNKFRQRLIAGGAESQLLDNLVEQFKQRGWIKTKRQSATDLPQVLETIRILNRIESVGETLRYALNHLAIAAPEWLLTQVSPDWFDRYGTLFEQYRLPKKTDLQQLTLIIGRDGQYLLSALDAPHTPEWLRQVPSVEMLRSVWVQYDLEGKNPTWCEEVRGESEK